MRRTYPGGGHERAEIILVQVRAVECSFDAQHQLSAAEETDSHRLSDGVVLIEFTG
jgi:hypothetical protein